MREDEGSSNGSSNGSSGGSKMRMCIWEVDLKAADRALCACLLLVGNSRR